MSRSDIANETCPIPGEPNMTVRQLVEEWETEEWAETVFGSTND